MEIFKINDLICKEITVVGFDNLVTKHTSFKKDNKGYFDNDVLLNLSLEDRYNKVVVKTKRTKKIIITFELPNKNAIFHIHNETIDSIPNAGLDTNDKGRSMFFLLLKNDDSYLTFYTPAPNKFLSYFEYKKDDYTITIDFITEFPESFEGKFISEKLLFSFKNPEQSLKDLIEEKGHEFDNINGWSSWDYYFTDVNEECIKENVDFIVKDKVLSKKLKYILIDDGWEHYEGYWKEGPSFPHGLSSIVNYINKNHLEAGIWTCPIRINTLCPTIMRRNDFLVRDKYGDPIIVDNYYVLDPTHPDGEKFLRETYTYLKSCGFSYYKLDFVVNLLGAERFYDKKAGPYDAIRKMIAIIRECVGESSHIMGCNLPYGTGYGYVDSRRTGLDIHNNYGHLVKCVETYLPQFTSHKKIYQNDLDYLVIRGEDTSFKDVYNVLNPTCGYWNTHETDKFLWRKGKDFSYNEAKIWCSIILLSGSSIFLGDRLAKLNEKGLELIYKTIENADYISATPDYFFDNPLPSIWRKNNVIALINFLEQKENMVVKNAENGLYKDIFTNKEFNIENNEIRLELDPHDCVYLIKQ